MPQFLPPRLLLRYAADVSLSGCSVRDSSGVERRRCLFTLASESVLLDRRSKERRAVLREMLTAGVRSDVQVSELEGGWEGKQQQQQHQ